MCDIDRFNCAILTGQGVRYFRSHCAISSDHGVRYAPVYAGGVDCGTCSGSAPVPTAPPSSCTPNCSAGSSPCVLNTCPTQTCDSNCAGTSCYGIKATTDPIAPTQNSPANNSTVSTVDFGWNALSGSDWGTCPLQQKYDLCYGKNIADPCDTNNSGVYISNISGTNYPVAGLTSGLWYWKVGSSTGSTVVWSSIWKVNINSMPTLGSFVLKNNLNVGVTAETGSRNHICQTTFNGLRTINATVTGADIDGLADITDIQLRWNGVDMT